MIRQVWITSHFGVLSKRPAPRMRGFSSSRPVLHLPCWAVKPDVQSFSSPQGCIKLGLVRVGAGFREVSPFLSGSSSNPAGLAAGSRWSFWGRRGNDHRTREPKSPASRKDARPAWAQVKSAHFHGRPKPAGKGSGTRSGCRACCAFSRWSAPRTLADHRLPAATLPGWFPKTGAEPTPVRIDLKSLMQP